MILKFLLLSMIDGSYLECDYALLCKLNTYWETDLRIREDGTAIILAGVMFPEPIFEGIWVMEEIE